MINGIIELIGVLRTKTPYINNPSLAKREIARNYSNCLSAVFKCYLVLFVNLSCLNFKFI